jgi:hypothetical protein
MNKPDFEISDIVFRGLEVDRMQSAQRGSGATVIKITGESVNDNIWSYQYHVRTEAGEIQQFTEAELRSAKDVELTFKLLDSQNFAVQEMKNKAEKAALEAISATQISPLSRGTVSGRTSSMNSPTAVGMAEKMNLTFPPLFKDGLIEKLFDGKK